MAFTLDGQFVVPADRDLVWTKINDPAVLQACITGCERFDKLDDTHFAIAVKLKMGPLSTRLKGRFELQNVQAPAGCRLVGEGEGGIAGFAKGAADVRLDGVPGGTLIRYRVEANVGGRIAKLGGSWLDGVAQRTADRFFERFTTAIGAGVKAEAPR